MQDLDRIIKVDIDKTMRDSYIDYSMSVIVARALPDVRDGFKPVHRRILYGMLKIGNTSDKATLKCARTVGEVLGKYHPHGDSSVYGALVRLAQPWAMRYVLVDGQGNFGSVDGDSAAAMRYTEARLSKLGEAMMDDINKDTVDMVDNFDGREKEPTVLPTRVPNLLVNGASGIAVGMATNIPTHNLGEVIDGCVAFIDNPEITSMELMQYVKAPDFPTGGIICGLDGVRDAYETGRGRIVIRSKTEIESDGNNEKIVVNEIPYNVNKAELIKKIAALVNEKRIDGISNVNDESDREGMRIVIDVKRDANANVVRNKLFKMTELQTSFSVNCIALVDGRPKTLTLRDCIACFVKHRHEVVIRRTQYDKKAAEERAHILQGLIIASDNIDEVVKIIRAAKSTDEAREKLTARFGLDDIQTRAIVEMRLRQLTGLEQDKLRAEYDDLLKLIAYYDQILNDDALCRKVMKDELLEVKEKWGDKRMTEIDVTASENFDPEQFYAKEETVVTVSHLGYIKRTLLSEFRTQTRGGVGAKGGSARNKDFMEFIYPANTHNTMMFFTQKGRCFWMKVYNIPEGGKTDKGRAIQNLLNIESDDKVTAFLCIENINDEEFVKSHNLMFCTKNGTVKKTPFELYSHPRNMGLIAINLAEGDRVIDVCLTSGHDEVLLASRNGMAVKFDEEKVRPMGRTATGVRGMRLKDADDEVVGMLCLNQDVVINEEPAASTDEDQGENAAVDPSRKVRSVLVVSENGYGKRSAVEDYRKTNRGTKGVGTLKITEKTGNLVAIKYVCDEEDLMIINKSGVAIRLALEAIKVQGRNTQGVKLIDLKKRGDSISSVCVVEHVELTDEDIELDEDGNPIATISAEANQDAPVAEPEPEEPEEEVVDDEEEANDQN